MSDTRFESFVLKSKIHMCLNASLHGNAIMDFSNKNQMLINTQVDLYWHLFAGLSFNATKIASKIA